MVISFLKQILGGAFWPIVIILIVIALTGLVIRIIEGLRTQEKVWPYVRKESLFDSQAEAALFRFLNDRFGTQYLIFPQIHYSHLLTPRPDLPWKEKMAYRSRIDRKSADFIFCDKGEVRPRLIIELDGPTHQLAKRHARDVFIDEITHVADLKILHINVQGLNYESVALQISQLLNSA